MSVVNNSNANTERASLRALTPEEIGAVAGGFISDAAVGFRGTIVVSHGPVGGPYTTSIMDNSSIPGSGGVANVVATADPVATESTPPAAPTGPLVASSDPPPGASAPPAQSDSNTTVVEVPPDSDGGAILDLSSIPGSGGTAEVTGTVAPIPTVSTPPAAPTGPLVYSGGSSEEYVSSHGDYMDGCFDEG